MSSAKQRSVYSVACLGLDWRAEVSLKSLLGLLKDRMSVTWRHSEDLDADVIVYNPASLLAQALLRRGNGDGRHVLVPCSTNDPGPSGLTLPLAAGRLVHCLEGALAQLNLDTVPELKRPPLCQRLDDLLQARDVIGVTLSIRGHNGVLDREQRLVHWSSRLDADALAGLLLEDVELEPVHTGESALLRTMARDAVTAAPWEALLWAVGVSTSAGRLLGRLDAARACRLARWPDFGLIGGRSTDIKCSALLSHQALSPQGVQDSTGFPAAAVLSFFNACALCGFLEETAAASAAPAGARAGSLAGGMLARIRKALSLGSAV